MTIPPNHFLIINQIILWKMTFENIKLRWILGLYIHAVESVNGGGDT